MEKEAEKKAEFLENGIIAGVLIEPLVTESATMATSLNKYIFKISQRANKKQIREAVEKSFGVKVVSINTVSIPRKRKATGRTMGWRAGYRKAIVTLKEGDSINLFESK